MPSIIPSINPPAGGPNSIGEIRFSTNVTVTANQIYYSHGTNIRVFWSDHDGIGRFVNSGVIWNESTENVSAAVGGFYIDQIANIGTIMGHSVAGNAYGVFVGGAGSLVDNSGAIYAITLQGNATAVEHWDNYVRVINSGTIAAQALSEGLAGVGSALTIGMFNGGTIVNDVGGSILAEGLYATAIIMGDNGDITNHGTIAAQTLGANASVGINIAYSGGATIVNDGLIRADIAIQTALEWYNPYHLGTASVTNLAGGVIEGAIDMRAGNDTVINQGSITGTVSLGDDDDVFDTSQGQFTGVADLGANNDIFLGSAGDDAVMGGRNDDQLTGNGGNDLLLGGAGQDVLVGGIGNDGLYGETGRDTIETLGGDRADGGTGDDMVRAGDLNFALIDGGAGHDSLSFAGSTLRLDLQAAIATSRLASIEHIDLHDDQAIAIRAGDAAALSGENATLEVRGDADNHLDLVGGWTANGSVQRHGETYRRYSLGGETVLVGGDTIVTLGAAGTGFTGLGAVAVGPAAPLAGSVPGATPNPDGLLTISNYSLPANLTIDLGETWRSPSDPVIYTTTVMAGLTNHGTIVLDGAGLVRTIAGFYIDVITNTGTIRGSTTGTGYVTTIDITSFGRIDNSGLIEAVADAGRAQAVTAPGIYYSEERLFTNTGTISARSNTGQAIGAEVNYGRFPTIDPMALNQGRIEAIGGAGTVAVQMLAGGYFLNEGTVTARNTPVSGVNDAVGFQLYCNGNYDTNRLTNTGTITAFMAIRSDGGIDEIVNRGSILGSIQLNDDNDSLTNSGAITGDISLGNGNDLYLGALATFGAVVHGDAGDDLLVGGLGVDTLDGGAGIDTVAYDGDQGAVFVNLSTGRGNGNAAQGDYYIDIENVRGTSFGDFLIGDNAANRLEGMVGNDTLIGSLGADVFDGGSGIDTVSYIDNQGPIFINLTSGLGYNNAAEGDSFIGVENITGGIYNDFIIGNSAGNQIDGGAGDDYIIGALGPDAIIGGDGNDTASYEDNQGPIFINLTTGMGYGNAAEGDTFSGIENVIGELYDDFIIGDAQANRIEGRYGNDTLIGAGGADTFVFNTALSAAGNVDIITDFTHGTDRIELSHSVFAALGLGALSEAAFANGAATTAAQHILYDAATGTLSYDADGSGAGAAIAFATLQNHAAITSADFLIV